MGFIVILFVGFPLLIVLFIKKHPVLAMTLLALGLLNEATGCLDWLLRTTPDRGSIVAHFEQRDRVRDPYSEMPQMQTLYRIRVRNTTGKPFQSFTITCISGGEDVTFEDLSGMMPHEDAVRTYMLEPDDGNTMGMSHCQVSDPEFGKPLREEYLPHGIVGDSNWGNRVPATGGSFH
jgi:hypothetical protein